MQVDFFNGDADGIISLHQFRMLVPTDSVKFTGVKRDVDLLRYVDIRNIDSKLLTVFDISIKSNHQYILSALQRHNHIRWFDHHDPGDGTYTEDFKPVVDTSPDVCTSIVVQRHLNHDFDAWTVAAAYGDNLDTQAKKLGKQFDAKQHRWLKKLGTTINYNAYGRTEQDLVAHPLDVFNDLHEYADPFDYMDKSKLFKKIHRQRNADHKQLKSSEKIFQSEVGDVVVLPDSIASIRCSGLYSNELVTKNPEKAFAILTVVPHGYRVSIRASQINPVGADQLASQFETGGGRQRAAGINFLPADQIGKFTKLFEIQFG